MKTNFFFALLLGLLLLQSCRRYEDDPLITLRKPGDRMAGYKEITELSIDGRDTLSFFKNKFGEFFFEFKLTEVGNPVAGLQLNVRDNLTKGMIA